MSTKKKPAAKKRPAAAKRKPNNPVIPACSLNPEPGPAEFLLLFMECAFELRNVIANDPECLRKIAHAISSANRLPSVDHEAFEKITKPSLDQIGYGSTNQVAADPIAVGDGCIDRLATLGHAEQNKALARIVKFCVQTRNSRMQNANRALLDGQNAHTSAEQNLQDLNNILNGNFSLV